MRRSVSAGPFHENRISFSDLTKKTRACPDMARRLLPIQDKHCREVNLAHHIAETPLTTQDFSASEISAMAEVLIRRHGPEAADVAQNFMVEHMAVGDSARADAWRRVRDHLDAVTRPRTLS